MIEMSNFRRGHKGMTQVFIVDFHVSVDGIVQFGHITKKPLYYSNQNGNRKPHQSKGRSTKNLQKPSHRIPDSKKMARGPPRIPNGKHESKNIPKVIPKTKQCEWRKSISNSFHCFSKPWEICDLEVCKF